MKSIQLTQTQYDEMIERLDFLQTTAIPRNGREIEKAKDFGDLKENAEYHAAKDLQATLLKEANELKIKIDRATIIEKNKTFDKVEIGHEVVLQFLNENKEFTFKLIGQDGDGISEIDVDSKLGKAIYGKEAGATVTYEANDSSLGELSYKIISIR